MARKRIGIITIAGTDNYGAELQAAATVMKLNMLGYDAELIDYVYYKSRMFKDTKRSAPVVPLGIKGRLEYYVKYRLLGKLSGSVLPMVYAAERMRQQRFGRFHRRNIRFSLQYKSMDELYRNPPDYDVYVAGSDQVWNPAASSSIEPYFLTFAPRGKKKISYASSFGVSVIAGGLSAAYRKLLGGLDHISVRETNACGMVERLCGRKAVTVVDPTLLLGRREWRNVAEAYPGAPVRYVLIYSLSHYRTTAELAESIGKKLDLPVLRIVKHSWERRKNKSIMDIADAGPAEFLWLFDRCDYIVTDSYHGTTMAIVMRKPFYTVISAEKNNNSRMESLLDMVGLGDRLIMEGTDIDAIGISEAVDFTMPGDILDEAVSESVGWLKDCIDG